jgi:hypothetical protein
VKDWLNENKAVAALAPVGTIPYVKVGGAWL